MNLKYIRDARSILRNRSRPTFRLSVRGQSMIEFVVICAALVAALFVPIIDDVSGGRRLSTVQLLIDNLQQGYQRTSGALSLPE
jgi:hypothetical protein